MSDLGMLSLCLVMTFHCHSVNTSRMGGKSRLTRLLGMKIMRNVMTMKMAHSSQAYSMSSFDAMRKKL